MSDFDLDSCIDKLYKKIPLEEFELICLCEKIREICIEEPNVVHVSTPATICGDIHGQFYDLLKLFKLGGKVPETKYVFMGDYVDRGYFSVETVQLLLCLKARYPDRMVLLRGNHEARQITKTYGFYDECIQKYGSTNAWKYIMECFDYLSIAAIVDQKIFCVHGGLAPDIKYVDKIETIDRFKEVPTEGMYANLLWADPEEDIHDFKRNPRGAGWIFGDEVTDEFNQVNGFNLVCRAHQVAMEGFQFFFEHRNVCTVWSCPNYCYRSGNKASILKIENGAAPVEESQFTVWEQTDEEVRITPSSQTPRYLL
ncbi:hypothetical protein WA158_005070 [Blastocystis sp. Blastoise]